MKALIKISAPLIICIALPGCSLFSDDASDKKTAKANAPTPVQTPLSEKQVADLKNDINSAMNDIPPELRNDFQSYFACDIQRDKSPVTGERIRKMTAALKADRGLARCKG